MDLEGLFPALKITPNIAVLKSNVNERLSFFRTRIALFSFSVSQKLLSVVPLLALKTVGLKLLKLQHFLQSSARMAVHAIAKSGGAV